MIFSICDEGPCRAVELRRADSRRLIGEISGDSSAPEEEGVEEEEEEEEDLDNAEEEEEDLDHAEEGTFDPDFGPLLGEILQVE